MRMVFKRNRCPYITLSLSYTPYPVEGVSKGMYCSPVVADLQSDTFEYQDLQYEFPTSAI